MRRLRLSTFAKQTPEIVGMRVSPGPEREEEVEVTFLQLDILQQLGSGAGARPRRSRRSLHNKKSLKSVIEEARQQLSASVEARRELSGATGSTSLPRRELSGGLRFGLVTYDEYVDYEDIVSHQHTNFDSDYVEMR